MKKKNPDQPDEPQLDSDAPAETDSGEKTAEAPPAPETREDLLLRLQRLAAEFQNYQKRVQRDITQAREFANEQLMKVLITVLDDMERALAAGGETHQPDDPFLAGMQMVHDKTLETLVQFGLSVIPAMGETFDPETHQAMMQQPTSDAEPMTILQELQRGYLLKGRTLRPSAVIVAKAPEDEPEGTD